LLNFARLPDTFDVSKLWTIQGVESEESSFGWKNIRLYEESLSKCWADVSNHIIIASKRKKDL